MTARPMSARRARAIIDAPTPPATDEPGPDPSWWEETPAQAARYDRAHFDRDED